jgi:hypothetical protein
MRYYRWHCNFYIVLVAPPGIVSKSTTVSIAVNLLRKVPGVKFGPDIVTWPALVTSFANANESFECPAGSGDYIGQCALTLESSEFGNLVNPSEPQMIDLLVNLWDSKQGPFSKVTKGNGVDIIENPWINLIACTTPAWIAGNFPDYVIGGGFMSRCLFVYADSKEKLVAYPDEDIPSNFYEMQEKLVQDLEHISTHLVGPFKLSSEAREWGKAWYNVLWERRPAELDNDRFTNYIARKQTHVHKTAMILSAAQRDDMTINLEDLKMAVVMVNELERDSQKVFSRIGRTQISVHAERFINFIQSHGSTPVPYAEAYRYVHSAFPDIRNFEGIVKGAVSAGLIEMMPIGNHLFFRATVPQVATPTKLDS